MKKILSVLLALVTLLAFSACSRIFAPKTPEASSSSAETPSESPSESSAPQSEAPSSSSAPPQEESSEPTPEKAAEKIMEQISDLDMTQVQALADEYFAGQQIPEEYYVILKPISERVSYKIGEYEVTGDTAKVSVTVTSVDMQSALNSVLPGAATHFIIMQMTGKDVSRPEMIFAEYAAENIKWDELATKRTDTYLYLIKGADGEWKVDTSNSENVDFLNAVSGGGVELAKSFQSFVDLVVK